MRQEREREKRKWRLTLPESSHAEEKYRNLEQDLEDDEALCRYMVSERSSLYGARLGRTWNQANMAAFAFCSSGSSRAAKRTARRGPI